MTSKKTISDWLLRYYLFGTVLIALILIILGPENSLLGFNDSMGIFAIMIPVFIGQITIVYQWQVNSSIKKELPAAKVDISNFALKAPVLIVYGIFILALVLRGLSINYDWKWHLSEDQFKLLVAFSISILNATSVYLTTVLFKEEKEIV